MESIRSVEEKEESDEEGEIGPVKSLDVQDSSGENTLAILSPPVASGVEGPDIKAQNLDRKSPPGAFRRTPVDASFEGPHYKDQARQVEVPVVEDKARQVERTPVDASVEGNPHFKDQLRSGTRNRQVDPRDGGRDLEGQYNRRSGRRHTTEPHRPDPPVAASSDSEHSAINCGPSPSSEGLIEAHVVDDGEGALGVAEVVNVESIRRKRWILICLAVTILVAIIASLSLALGGENQVPGTQSPTISPTMAPSDYSRNDFCRDARALLANGVVHMDDLDEATEDEDTILCMANEAWHPRGRWYLFDGDGLSPVVLSVCVTSGNVSAPLVLTGVCGNLDCLGSGNLTIEDTPLQEECLLEYRLSFVAQKREYRVLVYGMDEFVDTSGNISSYSVRLFSNNVCDGAYPLNDANSEQLLVSTMHGSIDNSNETCASEAAAGVPGVWFKIEGTGAEIEMETCTSNPSEVESELAVYLGRCDSLFCQAVDALPSQCGPKSNVAWLSSIGTTYFLRVSSKVVSEKITIQVRSRRDKCKAALDVELGKVVTGSTIGAANQKVEDECLGNPPENIGPGVWFSVLGSGDPLEVTSNAGAPDTFEVDTSFDSIISVFSGSCDNLICIASNDNTFESTETTKKLSRVLWNSVEGEKYYILVYGNKMEEANFALTVRTYNDYCRTAVGPLALGEVAYGSVSGATTDGIEACGDASASSSPGVWYKVIGTGGFLQADTCTNQGSLNGDFDSQITLLSGNCENITCIDGDQNGNSRCGSEAAISWQSTKGLMYYILVHEGRDANSWNQSDFFLEFREGLNDYCEFAIRLDQDSPTVTGSTEGAAISTQVEECGEATEATASGLWYSLRGIKGFIFAEVCRSDDGIEDTFYTQLTVLQGTCSNWTCVDGSSGVEQKCTSLNWSSTFDENYFLFVHGFREQAGNFDLEVQFLFA